MVSLGFDFVFNKEDEMGEYDELETTDPVVCSDDDDEDDVQAAFGDEDNSQRERNKNKRENFERKVYYTVYIILYKLYCISYTL